MSKPKKKFGLQKDFSTIFEGVWVPPTSRGKDDPSDSVKKDQAPEGQPPASERQRESGDMPKAAYQEQPAQSPVMDELQQAQEPLTSEPKEGLPRNPVLIDPATPVEEPLTIEEESPEEATGANEPNPEIEKIISSMKCSKGFICYKSNFMELCKVKSLGEGKVIECSPENEGPCTYRFSFMGKVFCKCPLRYYIARNLEM